ncbi:hypothetical protein UFOVP225_138 [uncultured Caudovirales phage]|uniref:SWIM-type domain-containing protein n=1 Tax=uncultured Caudovirales phage TaxID=2100421 RepID=A0A6J5L0R0_9CAUD|nr:hypothetical protein UFOVP113_12 [uncultured Caudovirales phage]CAB5219791.1 hypothetical protein UFOVP225_138 [uncultured Caudovirales phage]
MTVRLIQLFLSHKSEAPGPCIFEVSADEDRNLSCTCPGFMSKSVCKHTKLVGERIDRNDGMYPFDFVDDVDTKQIKIAMKDETAFRDFIIKHAKIEVY